MRFMEHISAYDIVSYDDFKSIKYDGQYPAEFHFPIDLNAIWEMDAIQFPEIENEINLLQNWDRKSNIENIGAGFFSVLVYKINEHYHGEGTVTESVASRLIAETKTHLMQHFGKTNVPLGETQKLVRGDKEIALPGLPDVLAAMYTNPYKEGKRKGLAGESYIQLVRYKKGELPKIETIINYGASNHKESPHYADQMELFTQQKTKKR